MIASLPMYDRPETAAANDRLWTLIRAELRAAGIDAPPSLTRGEDLMVQWRDPGLVLSQTCGFPYRTALNGAVTLVATPVCAINAPAGYYYSVFVARAGDGPRDLPDFAGARLAYNSTDSQSGWAAPQTHAVSLGFRFGEALATGAHRASARAVAEGRADIAAIDALTWRMIRRWDGFADALTEVGRTDPTPALPYIAAAGRPRALYEAALAQAVDSLSPHDRDILGLEGVTHVPAASYLAVPMPPSPVDLAP